MNEKNMMFASTSSVPTTCMTVRLYVYGSEAQETIDHDRTASDSFDLVPIVKASRVQFWHPSSELS